MVVSSQVRNSVIPGPVSTVLFLLSFTFLPGHLFAQWTMVPVASTTDFLSCITCNSMPTDNGVRPNLKPPIAVASLDLTAPFSGSSSQIGLPPANPQGPPQAQSPENEKASPSATSGSPGHIFWVIPAFKVSYQGHFQPITPKEKFHEWAQGSYDPLGLAAGVVEAGTLEYSSKDGFCGYGHGWDGYGKCFGSMELDANVSSFIGDYALAVLLHQDPRYFRLGNGSFGRRVWYSVSRVFVTYNDAGHTVLDSSALAGTVIASGLSNLYYPQQDRGFRPSLSRVGIDLGNTALYDAAAEFWPDIHRGIRAIF